MRVKRHCLALMLEHHGEVDRASAEVFMAETFGVGMLACSELPAHALGPVTNCHLRMASESEGNGESEDESVGESGNEGVVCGCFSVESD